MLEKPSVEYFRILPPHFRFSFMENVVSSWWVGTLQEYLGEEEREGEFFETSKLCLVSIGCTSVWLFQ